MQSIDSYLLSIGVNPAAAVRQNGTNNYAGGNCPGKLWNCATGTVIVQVASEGGSNRADACIGSIIDAEVAPCVIVQVGPDNKAQCVQRGGATQSCTITQTGAKNDARIDQSIDQNGGSSQDAVQMASLTQTSDGAFNHGSISQNVSQSTHEGTEQTQDSHQSAVASQTATGAAENQLQADQSQDQKALGGTTQNQNATGSGATDCSSNTPTQPNECANIQQSSDAGNNHSHLHQSINEDANAGTGVAATQQQGTFSGGMEGRVHQETGSGTQLNDANQDKHQHLSAPAGSDQTQFDPSYCCGVGSQVGGAGMEDISQKVAQDATEQDASQESVLIGQSLTPQGTCNVKQKASNNSDSATNSESLSPCPFLILATSCTNGPEIGIEGSSDVGIQQELPPGCETFESTGTDFCLLACDVQGLVAFIRPKG